MSDEELRTASGKVLTESDLNELADQAERGYDVELLAQQPNRIRLVTDEPMGFGATVMTDDGLAVSAWVGEDRPMNTWFVEGCEEIYDFDQLRNPRVRTR